MANLAPSKLLGVPPEPFDGKAEKAEAFWNNLANYYYLNEATYTDVGRKVSAALTHFKLGTPAGEWAQDRQKTALATRPAIDFGTWEAFRDDFKKHFIPEHTKLEATNTMYTLKMGNRPFNEWYQEWSTHASRSGANDETKMFAFRRAIPVALHNKIVGLSPQPTTLELLAEKARDFDRVWRIYNTPGFTQTGRQGTRNRALAIEEEDTQINATLPIGPQFGGKLSKEEKEKRFKEKLCFYCGKPNHVAKDCRTKKRQGNQRQGPSHPQPGFKARATTTLDETMEDKPEDHPAQVASMSINHPHHAIPSLNNEDF